MTKTRVHRRKEVKDQHLEVMRARLTGVGIQKPRKLPAHFVWARDNRDLVDVIRGVAKSHPEPPSTHSTTGSDSRSTEKDESVQQDSINLSATKAIPKDQPAMRDGDNVSSCGTCRRSGIYGIDY